ncbi:hypothetical protein BGZ58_000515 [Dissophora ornata]|nr:hypothetical protein BGZ58_000515 [Dissophora ornata]
MVNSRVARVQPPRLGRPTFVRPVAAGDVREAAVAEHAEGLVARTERLFASNAGAPDGRPTLHHVVSEAARDLETASRNPIKVRLCIVRYTADRHSIDWLFYKLSGNATLAVLAGLYDQREVFREASFLCSGDDFKNIDCAVNRRFFQAEALQHVVEEASVIGAMARVEGNRSANQPLAVAHHLIALDLAYAPNDGHAFISTVNKLFDRLNGMVQNIEILPENSAPFSRYQGTLMGLCLAGVIRLGVNSKERNMKDKGHLVLVINILAAALSGIPVPGIGAATGVLSAIGPALADQIFGGDDATVQIQACILEIDEQVTRDPGVIEVHHFVDSLRNTMTHCGFG